MTCLEFHRDPYDDSLRTCTLELTLQELKILNNALHFYCNEDKFTKELFDEDN